jgi:multidrug efflux system outer membrane protein
MREHDRRTMTMRMTTVALALALAGCAVGPDYHRPNTALPDNFDAVSPKPVATAPEVRNDWWTLYDDPLLTQLVQSALTNNPNIRLAIARIDEARAALRETNAAFFPELDYSGVGARSRVGVDGSATSSGSASTGSTTSGTGGTGTTTGSGSSRGSSSSGATGSVLHGNLFDLEGTLSYEVDLWGRLRRLSESAQADLLSTTYAHDVTTLALAASTAQTYFALRSLDAQIAATVNTLKVVGESLDIARKRLDAGYSSALDYAQAETLRAQTQVQLRDLRRQRAVQEHQLGNLTSNLALRIEPKTDAGALASLPVPVSPPPGLPSTLLERRPDVRRDEQLMVAANAQIGSAKAALFPTFGLTGGYGGQSFQLSDLLKAPFRFWNIGLGISGPIFAGGKYVARLDEARARGNEQIATYQSTVEGAFQEVADALTNVAETNAQESEVMVQVEAARRTLRLSDLRYKSGYAAYLDVLDATRTANQAEITLVQNRAARLNYSVDLFKALGGGWSADAANPGGSGSPLPANAPVAPAATAETMPSTTASR